MLKVQVKGLAEARAALSEFSDRRFRAAVSTSLTRAAKEMSLDWQDQIDRRIDRPNPRSQSATTFLSATAATLQAEVRVKDQQSGTPAATYLNPQERAGGRRLKLFEQALQNSGAMPRGYVVVPGRGAQLDGYGNVSRSQIIAVITQLGSQYSPGYARVIPKTIVGRIEAMKRRGKNYVAVQPEDQALLKVSPGIYERDSDGGLKAVFIYKRAVRYRKVLDLELTAERDAPKIIQAEFIRAVNESFARLRASQSGAA